MSTVADLMGLGMPGPLANRLGNTPAAVTGTGTAAVGAALIQTSVTVLTTASSQTACILPAAASLGRPFTVFCTSATTGLVYPPTGGNFNNGSTDASFSLAQNKAAIFTRLSSTLWCVNLTA